MSTVAEIESAIEQLPLEDFQALQDWMNKRADAKHGRKWTSKELVEGAGRMLEETDPARADELWEEWVVGFYGHKNA